MDRKIGQCPTRLLVLVVTSCCMLLARHNGGVVIAQVQGDDDSDDDSTSLSPTDAPTSLDGSPEYPDCLGYANHIKDGYCDTDLNNAACGWDGGDCCACTCGTGGEEELEHPCGQLGDGFDCRDPDVPDGCGVTPSPAAAFGFPDCSGAMYNFQNGYCSDDLNNAACGYDGGDCCRCTCRDYSGVSSSWGGNTCGLYGYDCMDPEAPSACSTDSPTPSPAAGTDYPECEGIITYIGDGKCDSYNNNEECAWDGGDCCVCTCESSGYYPCGYYSFDCLDPTASTDCPTPSPTPYCPFSGDGYCDTWYNTAECEWDGGDCCIYGCSATDNDCLDPGYGCASSTSFSDETSGSSPTSLTYSSCHDGDWLAGNGMCDSGNNNAFCFGFDGGDCCECDCPSSTFECGSAGFYCLDPTSLCYGSSSAGGYRNFEVGGGLDDYSDHNSAFTPSPVDAVDQLDLAGDSSESTISITTWGGILLVSLWSFCMLGWGIWGTCCLLSRTTFGQQKEEGAASPVRNGLSRNTSLQRRRRPSMEARRYAVKAGNVQRHSPTQAQLAADVAAARDGRHAPPVYKVYQSAAAIQQSDDASLGERKEEEKVEHDHASYFGGRGGDGDESKSETAHVAVAADVSHVSSDGDATASAHAAPDADVVLGVSVTAICGRAPNDDGVANEVVAANNDMATSDDVAGDGDIVAKDESQNSKTREDVRTSSKTTGDKADDAGTKPQGEDRGEDTGKNAGAGDENC